MYFCVCLLPFTGTVAGRLLRRGGGEGKGGDRCRARHDPGGGRGGQRYCWRREADAEGQDDNQRCHPRYW